MSSANSLKAVTQFSVFLANKPGELCQVVRRLAASKINIVAMSMMDATEHGVLRLVVEDPSGIRETLGALNLPRTETTVLTATLPNRPGALADVVERLDQEHIQVHYAYCTAGARNGKSLGVFKVSNLNKAIRVLSERKPRRSTAATAIRKNGRGRRR
ncbi:MAG: amino acid-binding protein [Phycisphaerae bacterium]